MIIICEPQCKGLSHEQVNSGFVYGLRLAYPQEKIMFFADTTHFQSIKNIWGNNNILIDNFEHIPINFDADKSYSIGGIIRYYLLFKKIFNKVIFLKTDRIFFLSENPIIIYAIKKLKQRNKYKNIHCTLVLHGELEDIAKVEYKEPYVPAVKHDRISRFNIKEIIIKLFKYWDKIFLFAIRKIRSPYDWMYSKYSLLFKNFFRVKKMLMWQHSNDYNYIVLSPHIIRNAKKYLDVEYLNFNTIIMPTIFPRPFPITDNQFIKFAVFGYGDSAQIQKMLQLLSKKKISKSYEIRIISMDRRGTEGFSNISYVGKGGALTRMEMENSLQDIDVFINLYDSTRHQLGCSGSIFEAFAYLKPVLHLSNDGYDYFNKSEKPIGLQCKNLEEYAMRMCDMIENYPIYKDKLGIFRNNMLEYRKEYAIENNLTKVKKAFIFS